MGTRTALGDHFSEWYTAEVVADLEEGRDVSCPVDLRLSRLKPIHANWLIAAHDYLRDQRVALASGWDKPGLTKAIVDARASRVPSADDSDLEVTRL